MLSTSQPSHEVSLHSQPSHEVSLHSQPSHEVSLHSRPVSVDPQFNLGKHIFENIHESWRPCFSEIREIFDKELHAISCILRSEKEIYPPREKIFRAFQKDIREIRVVILGQDPYHTPGVADGLAFSISGATKLPPSLKNILKEAKPDAESPSLTGDLSCWADQGVLLLNCSLTVEKSKAGSHMKYWLAITDYIIKYISEQKPGIIFCLWGGFAKEKRRYISERAIILEAVHPSPLSAHSGWFGSDHFSKINEILSERGEDPIRW